MVMPENREMSTAAELPDAGDVVAARAVVIASNDPTSSDVQASGSAVAPPVPESVGAMLRESREKLGLSPADIASKLRMGVKQVVALENSDYAVLPTGTFLRGFVRNYAKAVTLNVDAVLALLEKTHSAAAAIKASSVVVPSQQNIKVPAPGGELSTPKARALAAGAVILLLLAAAWYWWEYIFPHRKEGRAANAGASQSTTVSLPALQTTGATAERAPAAAAALETPAASQAGAVTVAAIGGAPTGMEQPAAPPSAAQFDPVAVSPVTSAANETETPRPRAPALPAGGAGLGFTFSGDSWVEVVDGSGKTILSRRFRAGDAEEVSGRTPFSVVIGNAKATRMAFNGREFELDSHTRGAVARVTVK